MVSAITQDELDTLFASIQVADRHRRPNGEGATAALYDFRYAAKLSPEHMRTLQTRITALTAVLSRTLSLYLNTSVELQVHSIDIASYEQYVRNLGVNPVLGIVSFGPSAPPALWEMSPTLAYTALDCMLGGTGEGVVLPEREATRLERAVLRRLFAEVLSAWTELWDRLLTLRPRVEEVVSAAGAVDLRAGDERLFCAVLEVTVARTRGMLRLCIPLGAVKRLLREEKESVSAVDLGAEDEPPPTAEALAATPVVVSAHIRPPDLPLATVLQLQPGTVLDLRVPANQPFTVCLAEVPKFRAQSGLSGGKVAVQILEG